MMSRAESPRPTYPIAGPTEQHPSAAEWSKLVERTLRQFWGRRRSVLLPARLSMVFAIAASISAPIVALGGETERAWVLYFAATVLSIARVTAYALPDGKRSENEWVRELPFAVDGLANAYAGRHGTLFVAVSFARRAPCRLTIHHRLQDARLPSVRVERHEGRSLTMSSSRRDQSVGRTDPFAVLPIPLEWPTHVHAIFEDFLEPLHARFPIGQVTLSWLGA